MTTSTKLHKRKFMLGTWLRNAKIEFKRFLAYDILDKNLKIIFTSNLLAAFGDGFIVYLLPLFIRSINATPEDVGLLYSLSSLSAAITIIPGGFLADRYDRKKIMIIGWTLWIPIPLMFYFAADWTQLLIPMFIYGITFSAPAVSAYVLERSQANSMALAFTTLGAAYAIGYIFSPAVAGLLSSFLDTRLIFMVTAIFYLLAALTLTQITSQQPTKTQTEPQKNSSADKNQGIWKLVGISTFFAVMMFIISLISTVIPQFLNDIYHYNVERVLYLGTVNYLGAFLLSLIIGRVGDRYSKATAISFSMILVSTASFIFIFTGDLVLQVVASFLRGASFPMWAYMGVIAGSAAPLTQRARWISVVQWTTRLSIIVAPYIGGKLYAIAPEIPFIVTIVVALSLAVAASFKLFKNEKPSSSPN
ncbi:MAG: MFS transporter [Candidatus Bathyarchaeota archaeon]|nr:MFS transporter [Candidatus Bathyarchaeota archaeon]